MYFKTVGDSELAERTTEALHALIGKAVTAVHFEGFVKGPRPHYYVLDFGHEGEISFVPMSELVREQFLLRFSRDELELLLKGEKLNMTTTSMSPDGAIMHDVTVELGDDPDDG